MKSKKALWIAACAVVLLAAVTATTLAFLTDRDAVVNTFTVGDVQITLDETKLVNGEVTNERTTEGNEYHLIPGKTYVKDPTMTVLANSEPAYLRMIVTINKRAELDAIFAAHNLELTDIFGGYSQNWTLTSVERSKDNIVYEFRYRDIVSAGNADEKFPALFTELKVPGVVTRDEIQMIADLKIEIMGEAMQAETFADADAAWVAFDEQVNA